MSATHHDDVQPPRAVRAEDERLLDVAGARRAGDQVDRARQRALAVARPELRPDGLVVAGDVRWRRPRRCGVGQEVERRRIVRARDEHQRAGLGDAGERMADARPGRRRRRRRALTSIVRPVPRQPGEQRIVAHAHRRRQVVVAQVVGDRRRHVASALQRGDGGRDLLRHRAEERDALGRRQLAARRDDALRRAVEPRDRRRPRAPRRRRR